MVLAIFSLCISLPPNCNKNNNETLTRGVECERRGVPTRVVTSSKSASSRKHTVCLVLSAAANY